MNYTEIEVAVGTEFMTQTYPKPGIYLVKQAGGIYDDWFFTVSNSMLIMSLGQSSDYSYLLYPSNLRPPKSAGSSDPDQKTVREDFALKMLSVVLRDNMKFKEIE